MYSVFAELLNQKGLKPIDVSRSTGISNGTFSDWKNGRSNPGPKTLKKIADFFGVSVDYLMTGEDNIESPYYLNEETSQIAQEIYDNPELRMLFDTTRTCSPEEMKKVIAMVKAFKGEL